MKRCFPLSVCLTRVGIGVAVVHIFRENGDGRRIIHCLTYVDYAI